MNADCTLSDGNLSWLDRLTQTGHLAIVFSQEAERVEYLKYLSHLSELEMMEKVFEELEVAALL